MLRFGEICAITHTESANFYVGGTQETREYIVQQVDDLWLSIFFGRSSFGERIRLRVISKFYEKLVAAIAQFHSTKEKNKIKEECRHDSIYNRGARLASHNITRQIIFY